MKKLVYIVPHLSTGGMPQYLLAQIKSFQNDFDIYCIEWEDITGGVLVVQKNKIKSLLGNKLITLPNNKDVIIDLLNTLNPDIIHFQEIPENFIKYNILYKIYSKGRDYNIVVTTHSSHTKPEKLKFLADKFVLVSNWSKNVFERHFNGTIPCDIWEYPIQKVDYNKKEVKEKMGFDPNYYHVLHVGLFCEWKNQSHIIELAKKCLGLNIIFHFVGNQADNFSEYWKPLMESIPENCIWHGEKEKVEDYYKASDLFYFPSLFELSPIAVKEAVSFGLPLFLTKLETYGNDYDGFATYINEDISDSYVKLLKHFGLAKEKKFTAFHILTDIEADREAKSIQSISKLLYYDIDYKPILSRRYTETPPKENCAYPDKISNTPGNSLTPAHYGCYLGHKKAFEEGIKTNSDYIIIFECDAVIETNVEEFVRLINLAVQIMEKEDLVLFSFGYHNNTNIIKQTDDYFILNRFYGAHAYMIQKKYFNFVENIYKNSKWDASDLFLSDNIGYKGIGIFKNPPTKQTGGISILDKVFKEDRYI